MTDAVLLPNEQKRLLVLELFREFGITEYRKNGYELTHKCTLGLGGHRNYDSWTASVNYDKLEFNCLAADTMIKVRGKGIVPIGELAGQTVPVMDGEGHWVDAPIRSYGKDKLFRVTLTRNKVTRQVFATSNHRWIVDSKNSGGGRKRVVVPTSSLRKTHRIPSVWNQNQPIGMEADGVARGFVFGDGTRTPYRTVAYFCGDKDEALLPFFGDRTPLVYSDRKVITGLPHDWKDLPSLTLGGEILMGWLAGYFAADGCVDSRGNAVLASSSRENLEYVQMVCDEIGVGYFPIYSQMRLGYGNVATKLFSMALLVESLDPSFFILPSHRERISVRRYYSRTGWRVVNVEETDRVEEVFCAEVPTTHSFVLADNIMTGNCFVCGHGGSLAWWIAVNRGDISAEQVTNWLRQKTRLGEGGVDLVTMVSIIDSILNPDSKYEKMPYYDDKLLKRWRKWKGFHPYLIDDVTQGGRGIPVENLERFEVGYADEDSDFGYHQRIIIPVRWRGSVVGWQARALDPDDPEYEVKYKNSPMFPRDRILYGEASRSAVVVESPMSVLRHIHQTPMLATFGAKVTESQFNLLRRYDELTLFMDPDNAGYSAMGKMISKLKKYATIRVVDNPYTADPADMDDETFIQLVKSAVPGAIWEPKRYRELIGLS